MWLFNPPGGGGAGVTFAESGEFAWVYGSTNRWAHGLGGMPKGVECWFRCKTSEGGWNVGDEFPATKSAASGVVGVQATNEPGYATITIQMGYTYDLPFKDAGGGIGGATLANWVLFVRAWR